LIEPWLDALWFNALRQTCDGGFLNGSEDIQILNAHQSTISEAREALAAISTRFEARAWREWRMAIGGRRAAELPSARPRTRGTHSLTRPLG